MKTLICLFAAILVWNTANAQKDIDLIISEIEKNNTSLKATAKSLDAEKTGFRTDIMPAGPELEFHPLSGSPSVIGRRTDFSISQSFEFPSAIILRSKIAGAKENQVQYEYEKQKLELLYSARQLCVEFYYADAVLKELKIQAEQAEVIEKALSSSFEKGEITIAEYRSAKLNSLNIRKQAEHCKIERQKLIGELTRLNGGISPEIEGGIIINEDISANFSLWVEKAEGLNPFLAWLVHEIEISKKETRLSRALNLPELSVGYMLEKTDDERFNGVTLGMSLPLWSRKNHTKYHKIRTEALEMQLTDEKLQFYNLFKSEYEKALALKQSVTEYRHEIQELDDSLLLGKSLYTGQITVIDYITGLTLWRESILLLLEAEKNYLLSAETLRSYL